MSLITHLKCVRCGVEYAEGQHWTCPQCGADEGILDVFYDLDRVRQTLTREALASRTRSHWRYRELLPLDDAFCPTDGDIGWTPIIETPRLAGALGVGRLRLKDDGRSASGSFKDRASSVGVQRALQEGYDQIACASTGNAASSLAHCAAAAGIRANIFVSRIVPAGKLAQLLAYGARVFKVDGTYAQAYDLCTQACRNFGWYNRNCAVNPYLVEGKKTGGLEVAEQGAADPPEWVACSVGDGCSIAGVRKGIALMKAIGLIDWDARLLGVQAAGVAPIADEWQRLATGQSAWGRHPARHPSDQSGWGGHPARQPADQSGWGGHPARQPADPSREHERAAVEPGDDSPGTESDGDTYADSINVPVPRNWRKALHAVRDSDGAFVTVSDEQIMEAVRLTGSLSGVFAEPAAAAAVAGIAETRARGILHERSNVVAMITGNGLKDINGALRAVGTPYEIPPALGRVLEVVESNH